MPFLSLRSAVLVGLLLGSSAAPSLAASVQHQGDAKSAAPLATYGMQVESQRALVDVLPGGWLSNVAPGVSLEGKVSWAPTDTWLIVLDRIAARNERDVVINWESKEVRIDTPAVVAQVADGSKPSAFAAAPIQPVIDTPIGASATATHTPPAVAELPKVESPATPVVKASAAGPARSFNRRPVREVFEALAEYHGLELIYDAGDLVMPGALTIFMDRKLENDMELIHLALGAQIRLQVTHFEKEAQLIVAPGAVFSYASFDARPVEPVKRSLFARVFGTRTNATFEEDPKSLAALADVSIPETPVVVPEPMLPNSVMEVASPNESSTAVLASDSAPPAETVVVVAPAAPAPVFVLDIAQGELLSAALERLLKQQGWTLVWRAHVDLQAATPARVSGGSLAEVLQQVLPQLDLTADLYNPSRTAVIRTTQATASQGAP